jgi:hypothetical protein
MADVSQINIKIDGTELANATFLEVVQRLLRDRLPNRNITVDEVNPEGRSPGRHRVPPGSDRFARVPLA